MDLAQVGTMIGLIGGIAAFGSPFTSYLTQSLKFVVGRKTNLIPIMNIGISWVVSTFIFFFIDAGSIYLYGSHELSFTGLPLASKIVLIFMAGLLGSPAGEAFYRTMKNKDIFKTAGQIQDEIETSTGVEINKVSNTLAKIKEYYKDGHITLNEIMSVAQEVGEIVNDVKEAQENKHELLGLPKEEEGTFRIDDGNELTTEPRQLFYVAPGEDPIQPFGIHQIEEPIEVDQSILNNPKITADATIDAVEEVQSTPTINIID